MKKKDLKAELDSMSDALYDALGEIIELDMKLADSERENERLQREVDRLTLRCEQLEEEVESYEPVTSLSNEIHFGAGQMVGRYKLRREQGDGDKVLANLWKLGQSVYGSLFTDNLED